MKITELSSQARSNPPKAGQTDYLADATRTYLDALEESRVAFAFADSAFSVLQREIERTGDPAERQRALSELTIASTSAAQIVLRAVKHADYLTELVDIRHPAPGWQTAAPIRVFFSYPKEDVPLRVHVEPASAYRREPPEEPEAYWRRVRDDLQAYFNVNLRDLQRLIGVAYPTLVNLGKRKPHSSTARAVLQLHALATLVLRSRGESAGREWLATAGRRILERESFDAFKAAAVGDPSRIQALGGIFLDEEPEPTATAPAATRIWGERF